MEQDPFAILATVTECLEQTARQCREKGYSPADFKAVGITNQRETTIVWDPATGAPL